MKNALISILGTRTLLFVLVGFCILVGYQHLDIQNKSRQLKTKDYEISKLETQKKNYQFAQIYLEKDIANKELQSAQLKKELASLKNTPVTSSCGPSVHKALEILREQNN